LTQLQTAIFDHLISIVVKQEEQSSNVSFRMLAGFETLSYPIVHPNPPIKSHDNLDFVVD